MASKKYCPNAAEELEFWSERLHDLSSDIDTIPSIDKYRMLPQIEKLHIIMTELDDRLCNLMESCGNVESIREKRLSGFRSPMEKTTGVDHPPERFDYDIGG